MSDDDSKSAPLVYENLHTSSDNSTTSKGMGPDTSGSDLSSGSIGKEDFTESKVPLIPHGNKRKNDGTSSSDCPKSDSTEVGNSIEDLPLDSLTESIGNVNFNVDDTNVKLPASKRLRPDTSTSNISTADSSRNAVENPTYENITRSTADTSDISTINSIESRNAVENPTYENITRNTADTSDISTIDSIESRNAVENPTYENITRSASDASGSNYVAMDEIERENAVENPTYENIPRSAVENHTYENIPRSAIEIPTYENIPSSAVENHTYENIPRSAVENPTYENIPRSGSNYVAMDATEREGTDIPTTSGEDNLSQKSEIEKILLALRDISVSQKKIESQLSVIQSSIVINRELENEHYRNLEREHAVITRNQGTMAASVEDIGNVLTIIGEHVTSARNES